MKKKILTAENAETAEERNWNAGMMEYQIDWNIGIMECWV
jgi:hypothetical protein